MSSFLAMVTDVNSGNKSLMMVEPVAAGARPDQGLPGGGGRPDQGLPGGGGGPVDPGFGGGFPGQIHRPDQGLPGGGGRPNRPDQDLPWGSGRPDQGLPGQGGERPDQGLPPLPTDPGRPENPIVLPPSIGNLPVFPVAPDNTLPGVPPGVIWPPLPPNVPQGKALVLVAISGVGKRWAVIDTSLSAGWPSPPPQAGQPLPPTATPK